MSDPAHVREQYATEDNLETRRSVWQPDPERGDPVEVALAEVAAALPPGRAMPDVLEVGSGPGVFAARLREATPARRAPGHRPVAALRRADPRARRTRAADGRPAPAPRRRLLRRGRRDVDALPRARPRPRARGDPPGAPAGWRAGRGHQRRRARRRPAPGRRRRGPPHRTSAARTARRRCAATSTTSSASGPRAPARSSPTTPPRRPTSTSSGEGLALPPDDARRPGRASTPATSPSSPPAEPR